MAEKKIGVVFKVVNVVMVFFKGAALGLGALSRRRRNEIKGKIAVLVGLIKKFVFGSRVGQGFGRIGGDKIFEFFGDFFEFVGSESG